MKREGPPDAPKGDIVLIVADDRASVEADLASGRLRCPRCKVGALGGWGSARPRPVRTHAGLRFISPRRGRCRARPCRATHVLLPDVCLLRRRDAVEVIGEALLAAPQEGYRRTADRLGLPVETVRDWRARFRRGAPEIAAHFLRWARALDSASPPPQPRGSPLDGALEAVGCATRAASLALGTRSPWAWASALTGGHLLCNTGSPWPEPE